MIESDDGVAEGLAVSRWQAGADAGDPECMYDLGMYLVHVEGDWRAGQAWLEQAGAKGHEAAAFALADLYGEQDDEPWERTESVLASIAEQRTPQSLFRLAEHYLIDKGQPEKAEPLMLQAAQAGHVHAMGFMASFFCAPRGDVEQARRWRVRAAALGSWVSSYQLAEMDFAKGEIDRGRQHLQQALARNCGGTLRSLADAETLRDRQEDLLRAAAYAGESSAAAGLSIRLRDAGRAEEANELDAFRATMTRQKHEVRQASIADRPWWRDA